MRKILDPINILPAALLAFVSWLGVNAVSSNEAIASLQMSQQENARVNEMVYGLNATISSMNTKLDSIEVTVNKNIALTKSLSKSQDRINLKVLCNSLFSDINSNNYIKCMKQVTGVK